MANTLKGRLEKMNSDNFIPVYEIINVTIDNSNVDKDYVVKTIPTGYLYKLSYFMAYEKTATTVVNMKVDDVPTGFYATNVYAELNLKNYFGDFINASSSIKVTAKSSSGNAETRTFIIYGQKKLI